MTDRDDGAQAVPGRSCPPGYGYRAADLAGAPELIADTLYVIGGLYGNLQALDAIEAMAARESGPVTLVFNGDFHWFDVDPVAFARIEAVVGDHHALRGNVETELASGPGEAGCGCAYPEWVGDDEVSRSNAIIERLAETAAGLPGVRERLAALPMLLRGRVGDLPLAIVHGDAESLAGWGFSQEQVDDPLQQQKIRRGRDAELQRRPARRDHPGRGHTVTRTVAVRHAYRRGAGRRVAGRLRRGRVESRLRRQLATRFPCPRQLLRAPDARTRLPPRCGGAPRCRPEAEVLVQPPFGTGAQPGLIAWRG
jgi:hypothetical protein